MLCLTMCQWKKKTCLKILSEKKYDSLGKNLKKTKFCEKSEVL